MRLIRKYPAKFFTLLLWVAIAAPYGCGKEEQSSAPITAEFVNSAIASSSAGNKLLRITTAGEWNVSLDFSASQAGEWCQAAPLSGSGNGEVWFSMGMNTANDPRTVTVSISSGEYSLVLEMTQRGVGTPIPTTNIEMPAIEDIEWTFSHSPSNITLEYNPDRKHSKWVAWALDRTYLGTSGRSDAWDWDPQIPRQYAPVSEDFYGYDRGHLCPSADRTATLEMNVQTFFYSNMSPQVGVGFNRVGGKWESLESLLRALARGTGNDVLYICAGGTIRDGQIIGLSQPSGMAIPRYFFKVVVRRRGTSGAYDGIGFWFENRSYGEVPVDAGDTRTIDEIEGLTGIDFFVNLPQDTQNRVEAERNPSAWGL